MMEDVENLLQQLQAGDENTMLQAVILTTKRPFKGAQLPMEPMRRISKDKTEIEAEKQAFDRIAKTLNTSGIDTLIVLIRALVAFGYQPNLTPEIPQTPDLQRLFSASLGKVGDDRSSDIKMKGEVLKFLYGNVTLKDFKKHPIPFGQLIEDFLSVIKGHGQFCLCRIQVQERQGVGLIPTRKEHFSCIWHDGWTLRESLEGMFEKKTPIEADTKSRRLVCDRPHFIRITRLGPFNIRNALSLEFRAFCRIPGEHLELPPKTTFYKLLAVIRLADDQKGFQDRIRIYNTDNAELISIFTEEEEESVRRPYGWTTEQDCRFILIYRIFVNMTGTAPAESGCAPEFLRKDAPEYEPYDCNGNEVEMEQPKPPAPEVASSPPTSPIDEQPQKVAAPVSDEPIAQSSSDIPHAEAQTSPQSNVAQQNIGHAIYTDINRTPLSVLAEWNELAQNRSNESLKKWLNQNLSNMQHGGEIIPLEDVLEESSLSNHNHRARLVRVVEIVWGLWKDGNKLMDEVIAENLRYQFIECYKKI